MVIGHDLIAVHTSAFGISLIGTAPMAGPLAILVLDRSLGGQFGAALAIGAVGSAIEGLIAALVALGLTAAVGESSGVLAAARLAGAWAALGIGIVLLTRPAILDKLKTNNTQRSVASGVAATLLNPTLLATWTAVVATLRAHSLFVGGLVESAVFGMGVALGSFTWLGCAVWATTRYSGEALARYRQTVIRAAGSLLTCAAVVLLLAEYSSSKS